MNKENNSAIRYTIIATMTMIILTVLFLGGFIISEFTGELLHYQGAIICGLSAIIIQNFYIMKKIDKDN